MLIVRDVSRSFAGRTILDSISFVVNPGERIGLIGPNGAGKSTLLRIIAGEEQADRGAVALSPRERIGVLRQGFADLEHGTLADLLDPPSGGLAGAALDLDRILSDGDGSEAWITAYEQALERFEAAGGYEARDALTAALSRMGLGDRSWSTALTSLSGGEKTRAGLAALVAGRADYLLLDEPTNHLDRDGQVALIGLLQESQAGVVVVSHERQFLEDLVGKLVILDDEMTTARTFVGRYSDYTAIVLHESEQLAVAWRQQQETIQRIRGDIRAVAGHAQKTERATQNDSARRLAKKVAKTAKVRERKLERMLTSEELIERPERRWSMAADFAPASETGRDVVRLDAVSIALGGKPILRDIDLLIRSGDRVALTGRNGTGKTTLMRVITGELQPDSGAVRMGAGVRPGWYAQEGETLNPLVTAVDAVRQRSEMNEGEARAFLHRFLFTAANVTNRIGTLSYGERSRLALALLVLDGCNLLLLDEPLNHLDIGSREQFESALGEFEGTLIIVLHDLFTVERLCTRRIELTEGGIEEMLL